jgi:hypothetical protein
MNEVVLIMSAMDGVLYYANYLYYVKLNDIITKWRAL